MSTIKNVIVVGVSQKVLVQRSKNPNKMKASGNLGPIIVKSLLDASFTVSILTRDASKPLPFPATVRTFQTDYSPSSLAIAFRNQDAVVSAIGALGTLTQIQLIDAAIDNGVKRFIPSDFAPNSPDLSDMERDLPELHMRLKPKTTIVEYLKKKAGENPGFTWSAVGSGPLFDWVRFSSLKRSFGGMFADRRYIDIENRFSRNVSLNTHSNDHRFRQRAILHYYTRPNWSRHRQHPSQACRDSK